MPYLVIEKKTGNLVVIEVEDPGDAYPDHTVVQVDNVKGLKVYHPPIHDPIAGTTPEPESFSKFTRDEVLVMLRKKLRQRRRNLLRDILVLLDVDSPLTTVQKTQIRNIKNTLINLDFTNPDTLSFPELPTYAKFFLGDE